MKIKSRLALCCIAIACAGIMIIACRKERSGAPAAADNASLTAKQARTYFYKVLRKQYPGTSTDKLNGLGKIYPYWNFAYSSKTKLYNFIEVPITSERRLYATIKFGENTQADSHNASQIIKGSLKRLIIYKNKHGVINQRIITYIPEIAYLKSRNADISRNQIDKLDKEFSGYIKYENISGKLLFLLKIKKGKAVKKYSPKKKITKQNKSYCL